LGTNIQSWSLTTVAPVPELSSWSMLLAGFAGLGAATSPASGLKTGAGPSVTARSGARSAESQVCR
jgi:hypothetical protein